MQTNTQKPTYAIEKNVPLPTSGGPGFPPKYPFGQMDVGDSVVVPKGGRTAAYVFAHRRNWRFACRPEGDDTFRVWRVA